MNVLPIEKQFEIMDLINKNLPLRIIAEQAQTSKTTVSDYKKRGPPIYRMYLKNSPGDPYPITAHEELIVSRKLVQETLQQNNKLIIERNTLNRKISDLENDNAWKTSEINRLYNENKEKDKELDQKSERYDTLISLTEDLYNKFKKLLDEKGQLEDETKKIDEKFRKCELDLVKANKLEDSSKSKIHDLTNERDEYKNKAESIERKHESDWIVNLVVALVSFIGGIGFDQAVLPKIRNFILSWGAEHGVNTANYADQISPVNVPRSYIPNKYSGAVPITIASSTFWSGPFFNPNGATYGYQPVPNQTDATDQSKIYHIDNGAKRQTNTSEVYNSGAYPPTQANNTAEYTVFPNTIDGLLQSDIHECSGEVMINTYTYDNIQTSGAEIIKIPPVYMPQIITPLPSELIDPYGRWIPIKQLSSKQSTLFLYWYFEQLGYKVTRLPKSHDKGGDILLERYGEKIVIQVKHRNENTGTKALQEVLYAKKFYGATKARVISFSPFTEIAEKDQKIVEIELWDLERLISEVQSHYIYYPIE